MAGEPLLTLENVSKSFGGDLILKGVSLTAAKGEFLTFLGPSGCGKTTTLRIIAGLESPDEGRVLVGGQDMTRFPPYRRDIHTVFQSYALFPHYNLFENIAFGLRLRDLPEPEIEKRVREALVLVKLPGFEKRRTDQISGGQMQRVALARAMVCRPTLLLLDEPFAAIDVKIRKEMQIELKNIQRRLGITFIYVTHDQEEALTLSDRIAVFCEGRIEQIGTPREIYERPRTSFVADFVGAANLMGARIVSASKDSAKLSIEGSLEVEVPSNGSFKAAAGDSLKVAIRPECIVVREKKPEAPNGRVWLEASFLEHAYQGNATQIFVKVFGDAGKVLVSLSQDGAGPVNLPPGASVWAGLNPRDILLLESSGNSGPS